MNEGIPNLINAQVKVPVQVDLGNTTIITVVAVCFFVLILVVFLKLYKN